MIFSKILILNFGLSANTIDRFNGGRKEIITNAK